ncbi:MAG TPA: hypothetical protein VJR89_16220 [Polyangiales bacterium]|nr:hypothetical protein [Polyangiales bacterium]
MYRSRLPCLFALCAVAACASFAACGDDGTEGLASCPAGKIVTDKDGVFRCAPRAGSGGSSAGRGGAGTLTASNSQQPKPAAGSGGKPAEPPPKPAAGSGAPPVPAGAMWTCVQVNTTCSCVITPSDSDNCSKPRAPCCNLVRSGDSYSGCVCYAENSADCENSRKDTTTFVPVSTCPPQ